MMSSASDKTRKATGHAAQSRVSPENIVSAEDRARLLRGEAVAQASGRKRADDNAQASRVGIGPDDYVSTDVGIGPEDYITVQAYDDAPAGQALGDEEKLETPRHGREGGAPARSNLRVVVPVSERERLKRGEVSAPGLFGSGGVVGAPNSGARLGPDDYAPTNMGIGPEDYVTVQAHGDVPGGQATDDEEKVESSESAADGGVTRQDRVQVSSSEQERLSRGEAAASSGLFEGSKVEGAPSSSVGIGPDDYVPTGMGIGPADYVTVQAQDDVAKGQALGDEEKQEFADARPDRKQSVGKRQADYISEEGIAESKENVPKSSGLPLPARDSEVDPVVLVDDDSLGQDKAKRAGINKDDAQHGDQGSDDLEAAKV